jgi:hypothetical protein
VLQCSKLMSQSEQRQEKLLFHLFQWSRLLMSAAIESNIPLQGRLVSDKNSRINLPLSRSILKLPSDWSSVVLDYQYSPSTKKLLLRNKEQVAEFKISCIQDRDVIVLPKISNSMTVDNLDDIYQRADRIGYEYQNLSSENICKWKTALEKSLNCIDNVSKELIFEIEALISVAIPVVSPQSDIHLSSSSSEIIGSFYISYSEDTFILSEAIVHEYHHNKLNLILCLDSILIDNFKKRKYYSPWRKDARPLIGLLHGCFAFWGVASYWGKYLEVHKNTNSLEAEISTDRLKHRLENLLVQLDIGFDILEKNAAFTEEGEKFIRILVKNVKSLKIELQSKHNLSYQKATEHLLADMQEWEVRNGLQV